MDRLDLLLKRADDHAVVLEGLDPQQGRRLAPETAESTYLWDLGGDPQDLARQRWGVIAPRGPEGDRLLALVAPLMQRRAEAQGAEPVVHRLPPDMDGPAAARWKRRVFDRGGARDELPRYQLILGDLHQVSLAVQQAQQADGFVGRLAFDDDAGYAAYVDKIIAAETRPSAAAKGPAVFHTVHDGSAATRLGHRHLAQPCLADLRARLGQARFEGDAVLDEAEQQPSLDRLCAAAALDRPGVLFTISHGLGAPKAGWSDLERMRRVQGALSVGDDVLDAAALTGRPFVPGGLWFALACYGAGTPAASAYRPWLESLAQQGVGSDIAAVLAGLPPPGARPFIAAAPKAALASPSGPLAVIGHVDLAWTHAFSDTDGRSLDRPGRFGHVVRAALRGDRLGTAHQQLTRFAGEASTELATLYASEAQGYPVDPLRRARVWMLRQDVADYVLLGDPAARLPFQRAAPAQPAATPRIQPPVAGPSFDLAAFEAALGGVLSGDLSMRRGARQADMDRADFEAAVAAYRAAGRAAIAKA